VVARLESPSSPPSPPKCSLNYSLERHVEWRGSENAARSGPETYKWFFARRKAARKGATRGGFIVPDCLPRSGMTFTCFTRRGSRDVCFAKRLPSLSLSVSFLERNVAPARRRSRKAARIWKTRSFHMNFGGRREERRLVNISAH